MNCKQLHFIEQPNLLKTSAHGFCYFTSNKNVLCK